MRRVAGLGLVSLGALLAIACGSAAIFYVAGNGVTLGLIAFAALPAIPAMLGCGLLRADRHPALVAVALLLGECGYGWHRVADVHTDGPLVLCHDGQCPVRGPWLARLIREDEAWYAAIQVAWFAGLLSDAETTAVNQASELAYREYFRLQGADSSVNGLLLGAGTEGVTELVSMPAGAEPVGALVFLHGFGGQLSPGPGALVASELGRDYAIVAPVLARDGAWWTSEGERVLQRTLDTLPPRVDRSNVWLLGLSNGAIGASRLAARPPVAPRLRGVVLLMGGAPVEISADPRVPPFLLVPARGDTRFPIDGMARLADELRSSGADVTFDPVEGDHFALFASPDVVTAAIASWLTDR